MQAAAAHAAVVAAALGTLTAFVEWAPLTRLVNSGVIEACGFFLGVPDFRAAAFGVVKQVRWGVAGRRRVGLSALIDWAAGGVWRVGCTRGQVFACWVL